MTILEDLDRHYANLAGTTPPGWSRAKFGWCIVLNASGEAVQLEDMHDQSGTKPKPRLMLVPANVPRTSAIAANFLWDKSAYVLGRTATQSARTLEEHAAFVDLHLATLASETDTGLTALVAFLKTWVPHKFDDWAL